MIIWKANLTTLDYIFTYPVYILIILFLETFCIQKDGKESVQKGLDIQMKSTLEAGDKYILIYSHSYLRY